MAETGLWGTWAVGAESGKGTQGAISRRSGNTALAETESLWSVQGAVVVAHPNRAWRERLTGGLVGTGCDVVGTADGEGMLHALHAVWETPQGVPWANTPLALVTDIRLPGLDDFEMRQTLREVDWRVPIVAVVNGRAEADYARNWLGIRSLLPVTMGAKDLLSMLSRMPVARLLAA